MFVENKTHDYIWYFDIILKKIRLNNKPNSKITGKRINRGKYHIYRNNYRYISANKQIVESKL